MTYPEAKVKTEEVIALVDKMVKQDENGNTILHPGLRDVVGWQANLPEDIFGLSIYPRPGTEGYDFLTLLKQIRGKQFMEAYQSLKGGGQITEVEGEKATEAMARMDRAQSEKAFIEGALEFRNVMAGALERLRVKAGMPAPGNQPPPTPPTIPETPTSGAIKRNMTAEELQELEMLRKQQGAR